MVWGGSAWSYCAGQANWFHTQIPDCFVSPDTQHVKVDMCHYSRQHTIRAHICYGSTEPHNKCTCLVTFVVSWQLSSASVQLSDIQKRHSEREHLPAPNHVQHGQAVSHQLWGLSNISEPLQGPNWKEGDNQKAWWLGSIWWNSYPGPDSHSYWDLFIDQLHLYWDLCDTSDLDRVTQVIQWSKKIFKGQNS